MSIFGNEDSYDRMLEGDRQFAAQCPTLEEAGAALHLAQTTFRRRKKALLEKLQNLLSENS